MIPASQEAQRARFHLTHLAGVDEQRLARAVAPTASFIQILCAGLRQLSEDYDVVPVDALLFLFLLIKEYIVGRDREARDCCATGRDVAQFRFLS